MCAIVYVDYAESTNTMLARSAKKFEHGTCLAAHAQTSGRGQRGNHWESEPGKNLTFSVLLYPRAIVASRQFELSQIVSIALVKVLRSQLGTDDIHIKWPNDIYFHDKKICGILIENTISGSLITQSIVGIGLNVNQLTFVSDAPNPVSMSQIKGMHFDLDDLLEYVVTQIVSDFDEYEKNSDPATLASKYRRLMWRGEGYWPYYDHLHDTALTARIAAVAPTGELTLATEEGDFNTYAFKEVSFVL